MLEEMRTQSIMSNKVDKLMQHPSGLDYPQEAFRRKYCKNIQEKETCKKSKKVLL
jgi:hypothetical protein